MKSKEGAQIIKEVGEHYLQSCHFCFNCVKQCCLYSSVHMTVSRVIIIHWSRRMSGIILH